ncbi:MAG: hypothetical protein K2R98_04435 [Gemmataceae bacterium]|nr:hypothetical protein [Gemmataceae bacterium]
MPTKLQNLYTGKCGQLAAMAEFLCLGYNVAIPEVDRGDDIFVVKDDDGDLSRVQVKAANAVTQQGGYSATVSLPLPQLTTVHDPELFYVLPVRHERRWKDFVVISRDDLNALRTANDWGNLAKPTWALRLAFRTDDVRYKGVSLQPYRNNWNRYWAAIDH